VEVGGWWPEASLDKSARPCERPYLKKKRINKSKYDWGMAQVVALGLEFNPQYHQNKTIVALAT
jgi:hypothetical protein